MIREIRSAVGERERRFIPSSAPLNLRAKADDADALPTIEGHGALFNDETVIGSWFRERILPGAFKESLKTDDIRIAFNHDPNQILGRTSAGTATVEEDKKGLVYKAEPPDTSFGRDVVVSIKRGDITGSSFQFTVESPDDEEWDYSETKKGMLPLRTIKKARLYETGPVTFPAYENTTVSARAMDKVEARFASDIQSAIKSLVKAIQRHARHMDGSEPTNDTSQMKMMKEMRAALRALDADHPDATEGDADEGGDGMRQHRRDAADQPAAAAAAAIAPTPAPHADPPAEIPLNLLERELDLLELD